MTVITSESAHVSLLPLSLHLVVTIVDDIAFFRATHTFWNNSSHDLDRAAFTFPLPAGCAVSDFGCDFGHRGRFRSITSKVQAREDARFAFEQSAQAKRPTGLLEQNSTEVFTATIGNIAGHARLRTYLTYFGYLRSTLLQKGSTSRDLTLTIPSSIAKRYGVPPPQFQGSGQALRPFLTEYNIHVYHLAQPTFTSNKKIRWEWDSSGGSWLVNYVRMHSPPGDFELCIRTASSSGEGQAFFEATNGTLGHQFAMMITIPPKQIANTKPRAEESDIIFLADRSGSMQDKIGALKKAMNVFLKGLPTERRFNIWCFGSSNNSMWRTSVEYNAQTLKAAENEVSSWSANMGGTELLEALRALDRSLSSTSMVDIIVLTDGQVWDLDSTVGFVKERTEATRGRMRFFALGIGTEVSHGLVEGIAKYGGGYSEVIQGTNPTIYAERLNAMLGAAKVNHISSIQVEVDGRLLSQSTNAFEVVEWNHDGDPIPPATLSSPADLSKIGGFTRTRLFLMYDAVSSPLIDTTPREVCIKEVDPLGFESSIARIQVIRMPNDGVANFIHKAAARALLGDLEFRESWIQMHPGAPDAGSHQEISLTRRHGVHLGCTWGLVSKWTSFFIQVGSGR
ncbi:von Willebrand factor type A domain-containing protein [Rhypophila decipiens]|uniref:von Willebrand factor type A domain-containing protein n=1 Tax=Rhypophila decipiens TaxID=261697 RepID=A0AAN6YAJ2_9PEZI|nr:von Willebrand factor type A domain-containing protein [Rhypophila decipiens]